MQPAQPMQPEQSQSPRSRTTAVVVSLVVGLALGAGGVGAAWALSGGGSPADGTPAGDARAACQALDGFDASQYGEKGAAGDIALNRWAAAGALSASAAAGDAQYKPLAEAVRRAQDRHARTFEVNAEVKKDLGRARGICEDL